MPSLELLPKSADINLWTDEERSVAEFIGFTAQQSYQAESGKWEKRTIVAPLGVRAAFLETINRTQLDPIAKQIYLLFIGGKWLISVSIDGLRLIAERTGQYLGQTNPEWSDGEKHTIPMVVQGKIILTDEGTPVMTQGIEWLEAWTNEENPAVARVGVWKQGASQPTYGIATWKAYGKTGRGAGQWENNGPHMLAIRAEAQALRKAFPQELSSLYLREELEEPAEGGEDSRDWEAEISAQETVPALLDLYEQIKDAGAYSRRIDALIRARKSAILAKEDEPEVLVVKESTDAG